MTNNEKIFRKGRIRNAHRKDVIKLLLGPLGELREVKGAIEHSDNGVILYTRESPPSGTLYPSNYLCLLRIVGVDPIVKNGRYDLFALSPAEVKNRISGVEVSIEPLMTLNQAREIAPILAAAKEVHAYQKFIRVRSVIIITPEMEVDSCYENDNEEPTPINVGDVFIVTDMESMKGYRVSKTEFEETHTLFGK